MTIITGDLRLVSDRPAEVMQVHVRARETRAEDGGLTLGKPDSFPVHDGFLEISVRPGQAFLVLVYVGGAVESIPILVGGLASESLENVVNAAKVATSDNKEWLEKLAAEVIAGTQGPKGERGPQGLAGPAPTMSIGTVVHLPNAEPATAEITGSSGAYLLNLGIPEGLRGDDGEAPGLSIGTVTTVDSGQPAEATMVLVDENQYSLNLSIPRGYTGNIDLVDEAVEYALTEIAYPAITTARDEALGEVAGAVSAQVEAIRWKRAPLTTASNLDTLTEGLYSVPFINVATALGLPEAQIGWVEHVDIDTSRLYRRQYFRSEPTSQPAVDYRRTYYNGTWRPWAPLNATPYLRGAIPTGADIGTLTGAESDGLWTYSSSQAIAWGLPSQAAGVINIISSGLSTIQIIHTLTTPIKEYKRRWYNGAWSGGWEDQSASDSDTPYYRGAVPAGVTPEDMTGTTYQGLWTYNSGQAAKWSIPSQAGGMLEVSSTGTSTLHQVVTLTTPIRNFQRRWYNGTWSGGWETLGGGGTTPEPVGVDEYATATSRNALNLLVPSAVDPTLTYATDHAALVADLKTRIGTVATGGKAAVALVADHGTTAFKEWLWAAAKDRNIPFTMALAPEVHLDGKGDSRHLATNAEIKQWISEGLVIASHSGDHDGATGYFDVARQIVTSKKKLEEKLETTVDCWVQPGYTLANGSYDGFGTGQSAERYTDYYAGRLLQQTYPVITGYAGDNFVYPGDADLPVGVRRSLMERKDAYQGVMDYIQQAIDTGGKHVNFLHPYAIPETSTTYVTKAEYIAYLDWLATKRDAGELVLLTLPQLMVARP